MSERRNHAPDRGQRLEDYLRSQASPEAPPVAQVEEETEDADELEADSEDEP